MTARPDDLDDGSRTAEPGSAEAAHSSHAVADAPPTHTSGEFGRTAPPSVVRARDIRFSYVPGAPVLDGVDLEIGVGEIVAIVGPRGAGKSTLLHILSGELVPTEGAVELPARRAGGGHVMLGYAGREDAHFESLSGWENAVFFARAGGMRRRDAEAAVAELMEILGLEAQAHVPVSRYDVAARRRLVLVEALAHRPALTVLDDPFLGLQQRAREALIVALRVRSAQRGTVVVATEDLSLLPELADRILFMHRGRIVTGGRVVELLATVGSATRVELHLESRPQHFDPRFRAGVDLVSEGDPYVVEVSRGPATVAEILAAVTAAGATVRSVAVREADLAEAFRRATGTELRP